MKAVIYVRISKDRTGEGLGVDRQREDAESMARLRGWEVLDVVVENDTSAAGRKSRPGFERVLSLLESGDVSAVIAWNMDRLTRNRRDTLRLLEIGQTIGATIALVRGTDLDLSTPAGRLTADMLAAIARNEIEVKSDRQTRANAQAAADGHLPHVRGFGYRTDGSVDPVEAEALREVYRRLLAGESVAGLARWLNDSGIGNTRGMPWERTPLRTLLLNPRAAGIRRYRGQDIPGQWEAIVSVETWQAAVDLLSDSRRRTAPAELKRKHLLAGLAVCGRCGAKMCTHSRSRRGKSVRTYACSEHYHLARDAEPVDELVSEVVAGYLRREDLDLFRPSSEDRGLSDEYRELTARRAALADRLVDGLDPALVAEAQRKIDDRLTSLSEAMARAGRARAVHTLAPASDPGTAFLSASLAVRRAVLDELVVVTLIPSSGGRAFDPQSVKIEWRSA